MKSGTKRKGGRRIENDLLGKTPAVPETLDDIAADHWREIFPRLIAEELVRSSDQPAIEMACSFWSEYQRADNLIDKKRASEAYLRIMTKYGMTPEGRAKLKLGTTGAEDMEDDDGGESDKYDEYYGGLFPDLEG